MRRDPIAWLEIDGDLHSTLYQATRRPRLLRQIKSLRDEARRYRQLALAQAEELKFSLESHYGIVAACAQRDGHEVERIIRITLQHTRDKLLALLRGTGGTDIQNL